MTQSVNVAEAKAKLSALMDRAAAGEEIILSRAGRPVARLMPLEEQTPRRPGILETLADPRRSVPRTDGRGGSARRRRGRHRRVRHHPAAVEVRLLLDPHALIWWLVESPKLSRAARVAIAERRSAVFVSAVSGYEIANKERLGRLPGKLTQILPQALRKARISRQALTFDHMIAAGQLPGPHRDPGTG